MSLPEDPSAHELTATQARQRIQEGRLTARALTQACLDRIERVDPFIKAWVYLDPKQALRQAEALDAALSRGEDPGPLAGIPVAIKDTFNTADMPTQMGSPLWAGFTPGNDARVVAAIRQAGGILLGKTVTAEFAVHTPGPTVNPHHPEHSPGTSSSGSAAAVAAQMAPLGLGSQTAGSAIRPASYCGIYGFKPSYGLIPRTGMLKTTDTLDTVALFARCPEDLELFLEEARVKGRDYPLVERHLHRLTRRRSDNEPWRVALVKGPQWSHAQTYAQQALMQLASELADQQGIHLEAKEPPAELEEAHAVHETIYDKALSYYFKQEFQKKQWISPTLQAMVQHGQTISLQAYRQALQRQAELAQSLDRWFEEGVDLVVTLSTSGEAPKGRETPDLPDNCLIWTLCGVPAVNLPLFSGPTGLPFGAQIVARRYHDFQLLEFARLLWRKACVRPPVESTLAGSRLP